LAVPGAPSINVSQLITFYFVGKEENLTSAAEKLYITQPAVTKQIRALENRFGVKLIHVKKRKVHLTEVGHRLFRYAEEIYFAAVKAESVLQTNRNTTFRVGISSSLTAHLTPLLDAFKESSPSTVLNVKEGASVQIVEELLDFQHDLVLVPSVYQISDELRVVRIEQAEKMVLVTSPAGPLAMKESIAWNDLQGCPFILHREGSILRQLILDHFREKSIDVRIAANIDSMPFMKSLIEKGEGLALMLPASVREEIEGKRLKVLPVLDGDFWLGIDIIMQKEMSLSPACRVFLGLLEAHFRCPILSGLAQTD
jgi:LysR family transcriptional regulator, low CO2-responsive transcriptional regulator